VLATIALAALPQDFRFAVVGHTRGGPGNGVIPRERLAELVSEIRRREPDFVVVTGDMVWGDIEVEEVDAAAVERDWDAVDAILAEVGRPVHRVPGNHDVWERKTREIWERRYGALQKSFEHEGCRFLLLNSCWTPPLDSDRQLPPRLIRGEAMQPDEIEFIRAEIEAARGARHVFVFLQHVLWWDADAPWWRDVHPLFAAAPVRAVFAGDLGPWKFSHTSRDGVDYVQSAVEFANPPLVMQRNRESIRQLTEQLDNFAVVSVSGADVRIEIETLGALTTGLFTPEKYRQVHEYDAGTWQRKVFERMATPEKLAGWLWKLGLAAFAAGAVVALFARRLFAKKRAA
jgi:3',5'-cyclic AMP phosphodiesterase CpdA